MHMISPTVAVCVQIQPPIDAAWAHTDTRSDKRVRKVADSDESSLLFYASVISLPTPQWTGNGMMLVESACTSSQQK